MPLRVLVCKPASAGVQFPMTPAEFDTLAPYIRALTEGKRVERKFAGEPDESWLPCKLESILAMGVAPGRQFRIIEPPLECWANVFASGAHAYYDTSEYAKSHAGVMTYGKPVRVAVHMREVGAVTNPQCTVIGGKTLDTGSPGERVAILASKDDLDLVAILASKQNLEDFLAALRYAINGLPVSQLGGRLIDLHAGLAQLLKEAFQA